MTISVEVLLIAGIFGFYLFDSALLLYSNEIVITEHKGRFFATAGSNIQIRGRYFYLPGPHTPHHGLFKGVWAWTDADKGKEFVPGLLHFTEALVVPKRGCLLVGALLLMVLPTLLLMSASSIALLFLLASVYLTIGVVVYACWTRRSALEMSGREVALLAVEAFSCPPFAINIVRKVCQKRGLREDALSLAERLMPPARQLPLLAAVERRAQVSIDFVDQASAEYKEMIRFRSRIRERQL